MYPTKLKMASLVLLALGTACLDTDKFAGPTAQTFAFAGDQQGNQQNGQNDNKNDNGKNEENGTLKAVDIAKSFITFTVKGEGKVVDRTYILAKDVAVFLNGKASKLSDLKVGMRVTLTQSEDRKLVVKIRAGNQENQNDDGQQNQKDKRP